MCDNDQCHDSRRKSRHHDTVGTSRNRSRCRSRGRSRYTPRDRPRHRSRERSYRRLRSPTRSRSRARSRSNSRPASRNRSRQRDAKIHSTLETIISRLDTIEYDRRNTRQNATNNDAVISVRDSTPHVFRDSVDTATKGIVSTRTDITTSENRSPTQTEDPNLCSSEGITTSAPPVTDPLIISLNDTKINESAQVLAEAIKSLSQGNSQHYFVSNFDPAINDVNVWCEEVERAKKTNNWHDSECLSRVSNCLKGDARLWLNEWITNDRTWSNFCKEFKPLCPRKLDYANILYNAMQTTSDGFSTYAEYARRTLLRLKVVNGLSDELRALIVIRGITDLQVRAAAANANLTCEDLVSFLSIYIKPTRIRQDNRNLISKRPINNNSKPRCFNCGRIGHKSQQCYKKIKPEHNSNTSTKGNNLVCSFCKKSGHNEISCFAKERSGPRNTRNVNLCVKPSTYPSQNRDLTTAVIQGVPIDVLIDSGALNVSLISSDVLKYFSCERKPKRSILKGISDTTIESDSFVTLTVEFDEVSVEADFVIVPGSYMNTPVIIGTDILNRDGITYIRTNNKQYLTRSNKTLVHVVTTKDSTKINTPLQGTNLESLMLVIGRFSEYLISGTASTTVTTGKMRIEVTNNKPVAYRPYRLSHSEKLKVREIVNDLKDKGIIRESRSEYASPIILVKKKRRQ